MSENTKTEICFSFVSIDAADETIKALGLPEFACERTTSFKEEVYVNVSAKPVEACHILDKFLEFEKLGKDILQDIREHVGLLEQQISAGIGGLHLQAIGREYQARTSDTDEEQKEIDQTPVESTNTVGLST